MKVNGKMGFYYNKERDALELWTKRFDKEPWGLAISSKFQKTMTEQEEAEYLHMAITTELIQFAQLGYIFIGTIPTAEIKESMI